MGFINQLITGGPHIANIVSSTRKYQSPCSCTVSPTVPLAAAAQASAIVRVRPKLGIQRLTSAEIPGTAKHHVESGNHFDKHTHHHPATYSGKHPFFFRKFVPKLNPGIVIPETAGCRCRCRHRIRLIRWLAWPQCPKVGDFLRIKKDKKLGWDERWWHIFTFFIWNFQHLNIRKWH